MQFSPMFQKIATATLAAIPARSRTSGTRAGGSCRQLQQHALEVRRGAPVEEVPADLGRPVNARQSMSGWRPERLADRVARAGDDVEDAVRDAGLGAQLRDPEQAERGGRRGLDDDRVAGGERGPQLPGRHLGRVVPRDHGRDHADRLAGDVATTPRAPARPGRRACRSPRRATGCRPPSRACRGPRCR